MMMIPVLALVMMVIAFAEAIYLILSGYLFLATLVILLMTLAHWLAAEGASATRSDRARATLIGSLRTFGYYLIFLVVGLAGPNINVIGGRPPALIFVFGVLLGLYWIYLEFAKDFIAHHGPLAMGGYILGIVVPVLLLSVYLNPLVLNGQWANAQGMVGEAGYNLQNTVLAGPIDAGGEAYSAVASQFDACNNRRIAELQCTSDLYFQGAVFEAAAGSASVAQCVEDRLEECGATAESEQVTEPLIVEIDEPVMEPFLDHLRVLVPVTNTLVSDRQGRPITMPAEDVEVNVRFRYLDTVVAEATRTLDSIQNGDSRQAEFDEAGGDFVFPTFEVQSSISNRQIEQQLTAVERSCEEEENMGASDPSGLSLEGCRQSVNWFISRFNETADQQLNPARVAFFAKAGLDVAEGADNSKIPEVLLEHFEEFLDENLLAPNEQHRVTVEASYTYSAEAAFTESSRWKSGNHLLKVWRKDAWDELSPEERRQWKNQNCGMVRRQGVEFQKQRTAALTTPVVPVMYADCGGVLFNRFTEANGYQGNVDIQASAVVNKDVESQLKDGGFRILDASTDCSGEEQKIGSGFEDGWYTRKSSGDFAVQPHEVDRTVTVEGRSQTIGCQINMTLRINLVERLHYPSSEGEEG